MSRVLAGQRGFQYGPCKADAVWLSLLVLNAMMYDTVIRVVLSS
jgi:hypothetical protein